ncbi:MAG: TIR domain-containing protein [Promethearchaeota archaeon]
MLSIKVFKVFFERYDTHKFPQLEPIQNTFTRDFKIPEDDVTTCYEMITKNGTELGILEDISGSTYVRLDNLSTRVPATHEEISELEEMEDLGLVVKEEEPVEAPPAILIEKPHINKIFIIHGKKRKPLEQLKNILDEFKVPYSVAVDEPHIGRPISEKIADLMHKCTSAIVIFTADEKYIDENDNEIFRPSDNAVFELGAAGVLYGKKIVILKETGVSLASDFSDLGYISFDKDMLKAKAMDLIKELIGFGFLKVTPT